MSWSPQAKNFTFPISTLQNDNLMRCKSKEKDGMMLINQTKTPTPFMISVLAPDIFVSKKYVFKKFDLRG